MSIKKIKDEDKLKNLFLYLPDLYSQFKDTDSNITIDENINYRPLPTVWELRRENSTLEESINLDIYDKLENYYKYLEQLITEVIVKGDLKTNFESIKNYIYFEKIYFIEHLALYVSDFISCGKRDSFYEILEKKYLNLVDYSSDDLIKNVSPFIKFEYLEIIEIINTAYQNMLKVIDLLLDKIGINLKIYSKPIKYTRPHYIKRDEYGFETIVPLNYEYESKLASSELCTISKSKINKKSDGCLTHRQHALIYKYKADVGYLPNQFIGAAIEKEFGSKRKQALYTVWHPKGKNYKSPTLEELEIIRPYLEDFPNSIKIVDNLIDGIKKDI